MQIFNGMDYKRIIVACKKNKVNNLQSNKYLLLQKK